MTTKTAETIIRELAARHGVAVQRTALDDWADDATRLTLGRLTARSIAGQGELALIAAVGELTHGPVLERWAPVAAILLAAGAATRMGRPKQVEIVNGQPMVVRAVLTALDSGVDRVPVVTGAHAEPVRARLDQPVAPPHAAQAGPVPPSAHGHGAAAAHLTPPGPRPLRHGRPPGPRSRTASVP